ncbi:hypothetical protein FXW78_54150 [Rhodococcus opacus]|nr:hypothetical protein [Rhodococcus opacus]
MVTAIRTEVNTELFVRVAGRMNPVERSRLTRLLLVDPATRRSDFDRLKAPARAATLGKFKLRLAHLRELDALGATEHWLAGIPPAKIAHFVGGTRVVQAHGFHLRHLRVNAPVTRT